MRYLRPIVVLVMLCPLVSISQTKSGLVRLLESEVSRFPAKAGVYVKHLTTGEEAGVRASEQFNSASVIKIPVMVIAYQMADRKQLDLNERFEMKKSDYRGGSGVLRMHNIGLAPTIRDVITQMIITSDNSATDIMIRQSRRCGTRQSMVERNRL